MAILLSLLMLTLPVCAHGMDYRTLLQTDWPALINGTVADRKDYPSTIWIGNCTAAVVGPRTVATAAHCVGGSIGFTLANNKYSASCVVSDHYRGNSTSDYALCHADRDITDTPYYENLAVNPDEIVIGDHILQSGFGCTKWGSRLDGQLRVGRSQVLTTPSGSNNDYETGNGAVLCSGDSGGPAWSLLPNGDRDKIISTNSRSNTTTRSYLSAWITPHGKAAIDKYLKAFTTAICGVHEAAPKCRNAKPLEPVHFSLENEIAVLNVVIEPGASYSQAQAEAALDVALGGVQ